MLSPFMATWMMWRSKEHSIYCIFFNVMQKLAKNSRGTMSFNQSWFPLSYAGIHGKNFCHRASPRSLNLHHPGILIEVTVTAYASPTPVNWCSD